MFINGKWKGIGPNQGIPNGPKLEPDPLLSEEEDETATGSNDCRRNRRIGSAEVNKTLQVNIRTEMRKLFIFCSFD